MSAVAWPEGVPRKLLEETLEIEAPANVIRTDMEHGPHKSRRRGTAAPQRIHGDVVLDKDEWALFKAWWENELRDGSLQFDWEHPVNEDPGTFRMAEDYRLRFEEGYVVVELVIEAMP